ncbi:hypothetical protein MSG28_015894 [Choristoneura fumiferana]|uniref:Uncharacterized protein n=1 Tax=Choristoneura fumiferana TaxID=7141 RepID=A0ACC0K507_CHOFU|nr:hypothetical protein MSG28_015894 [Choristoneura fumiferana]
MEENVRLHGLQTSSPLALEHRKSIVVNPTKSSVPGDGSVSHLAAWLCRCRNRFPRHWKRFPQCAHGNCCRASFTEHLISSILLPVLSCVVFVRGALAACARAARRALEAPPVAPRVLEYSESMVCYGCHKLLKDLYQFRQQVQTQSHTELTYIENSKPIQNEKLEPSIVINIPSHEIKTEIKIEPDYSDSENDVPLSEIKQKEVKIKKDAPVKNYEGKVRSVFLSEEEMLEDRMKEAMKEGYLNLPYKCESCITGFDHELTLKEHMEKRHYEVVLIFGVNGACRAAELLNIKMGNIEYHNNMILINLPKTKSKIDRSFVIRDELLDVVKKYINLRPKGRIDFWSKW